VELQKDGCDYYRCHKCTFLFHRRGFGASSLGHAIDEHYDSEYWANEESEARRREEEDSLNRALELIFMSSIPVKKILDFGCGLGLTVQKLRDIFNIDAMGVDRFGRFEEKPHLLKCDVDQLLQRVGPEYFDAIYSIEVFEHLENPRAVLKELASLLKPGGKLLINTMTWEAIQRFDPDYSYIDPLRRGHISIWSLKSLSALGSQLGLHASFMAARMYAVILIKGPEGKPWAPENRDLFRRVGSWYPQLMQEYLRLMFVEQEFEQKGDYIRRLKSMLNIE